MNYSDFHKNRVHYNFNTNKAKSNFFYYLDTYIVLLIIKIIKINKLLTN